MYLIRQTVVLPCVAGRRSVSSPSIATLGSDGSSTAEFEVETDLDDTDVCCDVEWSGHGE